MFGGRRTNFKSWIYFSLLYCGSHGSKSAITIPIDPFAGPAHINMKYNLMVPIEENKVRSTFTFLFLKSWRNWLLYIFSKYKIWHTSIDCEAEWRMKIFSVVVYLFAFIIENIYTKNGLLDHEFQTCFALILFSHWTRSLCYLQSVLSISWYSPPHLNNLKNEWGSSNWFTGYLLSCCIAVSDIDHESAH